MAILFFACFLFYFIDAPREACMLAVHSLICWSAVGVPPGEYVGILAVALQCVHRGRVPPNIGGDSSLFYT
jgi:hypothetical protein